jgi:hypothetical protein
MIGAVVLSRRYEAFQLFVEVLDDDDLPSLPAALLSRARYTFPAAAAEQRQDLISTEAGAGSEGVAAPHYTGPRAQPLHLVASSQHREQMRGSPSPDDVHGSIAGWLRWRSSNSTFFIAFRALQALIAS